MHLMVTDPEDREGPSTGSGHMSKSPEPFDKLRTAPVEGRSTALPTTFDQARPARQSLDLPNRVLGASLALLIRY
jgi:hypothetical protein